MSTQRWTVFFLLSTVQAQGRKKNNGFIPALGGFFVLNRSEWSGPHPFYSIGFLLKLLVEGQFLSILVLALLYAFMVVWKLTS